MASPQGCGLPPMLHPAFAGDARSAKKGTTATDATVSSRPSRESATATQRILTRLIAGLFSRCVRCALGCRRHAVAVKKPPIPPAKPSVSSVASAVRTEPSPAVKPLSAVADAPHLPRRYQTPRAPSHGWPNPQRPGARSVDAPAQAWSLPAAQATPLSVLW